MSQGNALNISTAGAVQFDGTATFTGGACTVPNGGTGRTSLTNHGVLIGAATSAITQLAAGTAGQVLQSGGASADPAYSTATFPATASGTGTILRADGTNWVATTATYPATTTAFQLLVSTATSVVGGLAAGSTGQVLTGVTGAVPAFSATPSVTSITLSGGTALSNYAEGTWTPGISFGGGTTGITYTTQAGYYTRIGRLVVVGLNILLSSKGSSTGNARITGFPFTFTTNSVTGAVEVPLFVNLAVASATSISLQMEASTTTGLLFASYTVGTGIANLTDANFSNNTQLILTASYQLS